MWKSRLKCGLLCKNKIVTIFLLVFLIPQNGTYLKKHASYMKNYLLWNSLNNYNIEMTVNILLLSLYQLYIYINLTIIYIDITKAYFLDPFYIHM